MPNTTSVKSDTNRNYVCYYCEEEIEFDLPNKNFPRVHLDESDSIFPTWIHASTGSIRCHSVATPSNLMLELN